MPRGVPKYSAQVAVATWIARKKGTDAKTLAAIRGVSAKSITNWINKVNKDENLLILATKELAAENSSTIVDDVKPVIKTPVTIKKPLASNLIPDTEKLLDENAFLRWWNQGERAGWVDRLLKELERK